MYINTMRCLGSPDRNEPESLQKKLNYKKPKSNQICNTFLMYSFDFERISAVESDRTDRFNKDNCYFTGTYKTHLCRVDQIIRPLEHQLF